ncbi:hypothetical protein P186_0477 [Pyrobaculum ferrireducens]|jgi:hypothetical protein|uniref:Uncharacterized protein n=1 Tax=Pyrobaculum ferrireducens TaxID=1104324 RepID=G7VGU7_9CREN|nr:hypothetical protein P186_0477 [Pyrobaculum ferrireducens]
MEQVVIPLSEEELEHLYKICKRYNLDSLDDCINMALAQLIYVYKGL